MRRHDFLLPSISVVNRGRLYIIISEYAFNCVIIFRYLVKKILDKNRQNSITSNFLAHNNVFTEGIH